MKQFMVYVQDYLATYSRETAWTLYEYRMKYNEILDRLFNDTETQPTELMVYPEFLKLGYVNVEDRYGNTMLPALYFRMT